MVHVRVKAHKRFTREGDLILSDEHVGMADAALGTEIDVETVDGKVRMKVPAGTQSGADFKLSGHGVPHMRSESRRPHIVTIVVDTPTKLTKSNANFSKSSRLFPQKSGAYFRPALLPTMTGRRARPFLGRGEVADIDDDGALAFADAVLRLHGRAPGPRPLAGPGVEVAQKHRHAPAVPQHLPRADIGRPEGA